MAAGLALLDYDGDGWIDLYLLNQRSLQSEGAAKSKAQARNGSSIGNRLYRNNQDGTFNDVTDVAGVASGAFCLGVVAADLDNDGDQDLMISNFGKTELYLNNGDGTFTPRHNESGVVGNERQFGAGIGCLDIDNDGLVDLYASNYVDFTIERYNQVAPKSFPYPPGPKDFPPMSDRLYRNKGDGTFEDVSRSSGIAATAGPSMGLICGDFDGDKDADIFVCSDAAPNQYYVNDGMGRFTEQALAAGLAFDLSGNVNGSMGVDSGDYDGDGRVDLLITNCSGQTPVLYRNLGDGFFEDTSRLSQVGRSVLPHTNWGVGLVDFDNDADLDVYFANGHFLMNVEKIDDRTAYRVPNTLMLNDGRGKFSDHSKNAGAGMLVTESSRGAGFGDLDRDGDIDVVVLNVNAVPSCLENKSESIGSWIDIQLVGTRANRDGIGAKVALHVGDRKQVAMVHAGRGYQSHYGSKLHFGIGAAIKVDSIEVTWPGGVVELFEGCLAKSELILVEGRGRL